VRQLLDFSRKRPIETTPVELVPLARGVAAFLGQMAREKGVALALPERDGEDLRVTGDPGQLQQVVTNLVLNAIQATPGGGTVELSVARERRPAPTGQGRARADWIRLCIRDSGCGMDEKTRAHLFEPFFTTKGVGEGTGLGLAVTHGIVEEHGGWIEVASELGQGSRFAIYLPPHSQESA